MTKLKISLHGNLYFLIHESLKMHSCLFSFSLGPFHRHCEKSSDRKYVLLRQADVKQKCCKVSVIGKKSFFVIFKTSGWLLHRTALKHDLLSTYLWLYVSLANFPCEGIRIRIMQVLEACISLSCMFSMITKKTSRNNP